MKNKESTAGAQLCTCPNPSCGKVFANPIKAKNLCSKTVEVYEACPFCLTEITLNQRSVVTEDKEDLELKEYKSEQETSRLAEGTPSEPVREATQCQHHLGYLSERSPKEKIPEECMVCENIVQCMLKNVTG
jgi:hypothetical protein